MKPLARPGLERPAADPLGSALRDALRELVREAVVEAVAELRQDTSPAVLTTEQLCGALQCSRSMVNRLVQEGCPHVRLGDTRRFRIDAVLAWLERRGSAAP